MQFQADLYKIMTTGRDANLLPGVPLKLCEQKSKIVGRTRTIHTMIKQLAPDLYKVCSKPLGKYKVNVSFPRRMLFFVDKAKFDFEFTFFNKEKPIGNYSVSLEFFDWEEKLISKKLITMIIWPSILTLLK